ncbi:MAG: 4-(cytidine 5'-diphospho)-2-C-methyl-D-erythritol kinase [Vibrio sp.]
MSTSCLSPELSTPAFTDWPSPAKLNLFLYITGQRDNGYHDLQTLFQFLDYGDTLSIAPNQLGTIEISPQIDGVAEQDNLIYRAAMALKDYAISQALTQKSRTDEINHLKSLGAHIQLKKVLPMGGGLGGGSSNAATALVALNHLWQLNISLDVLAQIGLALGADVPVFVKGFAAFAEGVGEKLTPVETKQSWYLVVKPDVHISTAEIFTHPDLTRNTPKRPLNQLLEQNYENDCEKIVTLLYPKVAQLLSWLLQYAPSRLTGTGACLFSEFDSKQAAQDVLEQLDPSVEAFIAQGVNQSSLHQTLAGLK